MHDKQALCDKIKTIYPDIGECGIDVDVDWEDAQNSYVVDLKKDNQALRHYLSEEDANLCMDGKQCVSLGLEIAQLRDNIQNR